MFDLGQEYVLRIFFENTLMKLEPMLKSIPHEEEVLQPAFKAGGVFHIF